MKRTWTGSVVIAAAALLLGSFAGSLPGQELETLLKDLESGEAGRRGSAAQALSRSGAAAVAPLGKLLAGENRSVVVAARNALTGIAHHASRPGAGDERAEVARALAEAYRRAELVDPRNALAELLSVAGGEESVAALAERLSDRGSREMARFALARIPVPAAAAALRAALEKEKDPEFEIALLNALGAKRDAGAVGLLARRVESGSLEVKLAAIEALSRIGSAGPRIEALVKALPAPGEASIVRERLRVFDGLLILGESLLAAGQRDEANRLYTRLLRAAGEDREKSAAVVGLGKAGGPGAVEAARDAIQDGNEKLQGAGKEALRGMPAGEAIPAIAAILKESSSSPVLRGSLLHILGERKEPEAAELAASALNDRDASVRAAALSALEGRREPSVTRSLLAVIRAREPAAAEGAVGVLARLPGDSGTRAIIEAARAAEGEARAGLIRALGRREDPAAAAVLIEEARADSPLVRAAAYEGLGNLRSAEALPILIAGLDRAGEEGGAAERALGRFITPEATGALVRAAREKTGAGRASLVRILGKRGGGEVLAILLGAARDPDEGVRIAALEGLAGQKDPAVLPVLLEAAESGPEKVRPAAVLGCLRFGKAIEDRDRKAALGIYHKALLIAGRPEEKGDALQGIGRLGDPSSLEVLKPYLEERNRGLREQAAAAILPIAAKLEESRKEEAVAVLRTALPIAPNSPGARAATEALRRFGVEYDVAREAGFITRWWLVGPFPNPENKMYEGDFLSPESVSAEVLATTEVKSGEKALRWKRHHTTDSRGVVNLEEAIGRLDNVGAYAYAEVTVPEEKRVSLKMGSDDSIVVWVNGKQVHGVETSRGLTVDQDNVNTRLAAGKNRILVKVLNGGAQWAFSFRITDRQGGPLKLEPPEG